MLNKPLSTVMRREEENPASNLRMKLIGTESTECKSFLEQFTNTLLKWCLKIEGGDLHVHYIK